MMTLTRVKSSDARTSKKVLHKSLKRSRARKIFCINLDPLKIAIARVGAASSTEVSRGKVRLLSRAILTCREKEGGAGGSDVRGGCWRSADVLKSRQRGIN